MTAPPRPDPRYVVDPNDLLRSAGFSSRQVMAERLIAITERWVWRAILKGVGNRVWRSDPIWDQVNFVMTYNFQILEPGEAAPGGGVVFGPFSRDPR